MNLGSPWTIAYLGLLLLVGCGQSVAPLGTLDAGGDAGFDDAGTRGYLLASTGVQFVLGANAFELTPADLATDADVLSYHEDFIGVPWNEFESGQAPPVEWVAVMDKLAASARASGRPVFLSLQLVAGSGRHYLADRTVVSGGTVSKESQWSAACFDFRTAPDGASKEIAYLRYLDWMIAEFHPRYLNVAIEINLFMSCGAAWDSLVAVERHACEEAHRVAPGVVAFPSIQIDTLYGYDSSCATPSDRAACYDAFYARLSGLERDRFAISTYPFLGPSFQRASDLPATYLTAAGDRGGERTVIAETGWDSDPIVATLNGSCTPVKSPTEADQRDYLDLLVTTAEAHDIELVTWWSNRDIVPAELSWQCPCDFDPAWCSLIPVFRSLGGTDPMAQFYGELLLKVFSTMGIRRYDGTPKTITFQRWQQARALPPRIVP